MISRVPFDQVMSTNQRTQGKKGRKFISLKFLLCSGPLHLPDVNLDWFRKKIGIVNQEPVLFANSIAENIAYGKDASEEEVR